MPTFWDTHPQILGHFLKITRFCSFWYQTIPKVSQKCIPNYNLLSLLSSEKWLIFHFEPQNLWVGISKSGHITTLIFTFLKSAFQTLTFGISLGSQHLKLFWPFLLVWFSPYISCYSFLMHGLLNFESAKKVNERRSQRSAFFRAPLALPPIFPSAARARAPTFESAALQ